MKESRGRYLLFCRYRSALLYHYEFTKSEMMFDFIALYRAIIYGIRTHELKRYV